MICERIFWKEITQIFSCNSHKKCGKRVLSFLHQSVQGRPFHYQIQRKNFSTSLDNDQYLNDVANYIRGEQPRSIVVMVGAGISTASGIPDFRSPGSGLYNNLSSKYEDFKLPYPEAIFDIEYFRNRPQPFFRFAKELYPSGQYKPNPVHYFIKLLSDKNLLLRLYTQNIDGLERMAGIPGYKVVEAHGSFHTATCMRCQKKYNGHEIKQQIFDDEIPKCSKCSAVVKPDIVFFGEMLPPSFYQFEQDLPAAELLLIMGTSLEVYPFASIASCVRSTTPRVLFNREAAGPFQYSDNKTDYFFKGDLVKNIQHLAEVLGWQKELEDVMQQEMEKLPKEKL